MIPGLDAVRRMPVAERLLVSGLLVWSAVLPLGMLAWLATGLPQEPDTQDGPPALSATPQLDAIAKRPLFSPERVPSSPPVMMAPPAPQPMLDRQIELKGVVLGPAGAKAFVSGPALAGGTWLGTNARFGGWTVARIGPDEIRLEAGSESFTARLHPSAPPR